MKKLIASLIILIIIMGSILTGDGRKYFPNNQLEASDKSGRVNYQSLIEDWGGMLVDYFAFNTANRIEIDDTMVDVLASFQVGDRLRILQNDSADYKYFFVVVVGEDYLLIAGGDNYTFTSSPIIEIAFSRYPTPFGWPANNFVYSSVALIMYPTSGIGASIDGTADAFFSIDNGRITISYRTVDAITTSGDAVNHYCFAEIPEPLQVPSGDAADQNVFPTIQTGYADNADDFLVGIGSLVIFEGEVQLGGSFGQDIYPWPDYAAIRMGPYADHKFGNASNSGNSAIAINGSITYTFD